MNTKPENVSMTEVKGYHAHVYYNAETRNIAEALRDTIIKNFGSPVETVGGSG